MSDQLEKSLGIIKKQQKPFIMSPTHVCHDARISGVAYKLWNVIESKPDGWEFFWWQILKSFKEGREKVKNSFKELEKFGYAKKQRKKKGNLYCGMDIEIFYDPSLPLELDNSGSDRETGFRSLENRTSEIRVTEKRDIKKERSKKDLSKQDLISLSKDEEREFFNNIWKEKKYKSELETFLLSPSRKKWQKEGLDLEEQAAFWEDGFKKKNPGLYKPSSAKSAPVVKEPPQITRLRDNVRRIVGHDWQYFESPTASYKIENNIIYVSDKRALKYTAELEKINIKIELK